MPSFFSVEFLFFCFSFLFIQGNKEAEVKLIIMSLLYLVRLQKLKQMIQEIEVSVLNMNPSSVQ